MLLALTGFSELVIDLEDLRVGYNNKWLCWWSLTFGSHRAKHNSTVAPSTEYTFKQEEMVILQNTAVCGILYYSQINIYIAAQLEECSHHGGR